MREPWLRWFAHAGVFYPADPGLFAWGSSGLAALRRLERAVAETLEPLGYGELRLPSLAAPDDLQRFLGPKADRLATIELGGEPRVLTPFSDLQFLHHVARQRGPKGLDGARAYLWSPCFLQEIGAGPLDFSEYVKCEVFSLHTSPRRAAEEWRTVNELFTRLCEELLAVEPVTGTRPGITTFPLTERSFSIDIGMEGRQLLTILVSHLMSPSFARLTQIPGLDEIYMVSSCFSQKLLAGVLLHHADGDGLIFPPPIAACDGLLLGPDLGSWHRIRHGRTVRRQSQTGPARSALLAAGAAWALEAVAQPEREQRWRLHPRLARTDRPPVLSGLDAALEAADRASLELGSTLRTRSAARAEASLSPTGSRRELVEASRDPERLNIVTPCCRRDVCARGVADGTGWIPKLWCDTGTTRRCMACDVESNALLVLEREEQYTSFYRPPGGSEPPPAGRP